MQTLHKFFKSFLVPFILANQFIYIMPVPLGNFCNILCPLAPITLATYFLHHTGINSPLQFRKIKRCLIHTTTLMYLVFSTVLIIDNTAYQNIIRLIFIKFNFVYSRIETVIMGTQGIQHRPNCCKILAFFQSLLRLDISRYNNWNYDIAKIFIWCSAHYTPY